MSGQENQAVRLEPGELASIKDKLDAARDHLSSVAETFGAKLRGQQGDSVAVTSVTYGAKILIVRTADGFCYVYDGVKGVCRLCDGVSDGET